MNCIEQIVLVHVNKIRDDTIKKILDQLKILQIEMCAMDHGLTGATRNATTTANYKYKTSHYGSLIESSIARRWVNKAPRTKSPTTQLP